MKYALTKLVGCIFHFNKNICINKNIAGLLIISIFSVIGFFIFYVFMLTFNVDILSGPKERLITIIICAWFGALGGGQRWFLHNKIYINKIVNENDIKEMITNIKHCGMANPYRCGCSFDKLSSRFEPIYCHPDIYFIKLLFILFPFLKSGITVDIRYSDKTTIVCGPYYVIKEIDI